MAQTSTSWKKGQSGNPKGRPPKNRALTSLLEQAADQAVRETGKSAKEVAAAAVWQLLATGQVTFPGGHHIKIEDAKEYTGLLTFVYRQIDGLPKAELDITSDGQAIGFTAEELAQLDAEADEELKQWESNE